MIASRLATPEPILQKQEPANGPSLAPPEAGSKNRRSCNRQFEFSLEKSRNFLGKNSNCRLHDLRFLIRRGEEYAAHAWVRFNVSFRRSVVCFRVNGGPV